MKNKLKCILLIDDNEGDNFLHRIVIEEMDCAEKIVTVNHGGEALDYLTTKEDGKYPQPDIIFLDINMPVMDGWEFLEHYEKLEQAQQGGMVVYMLTTSLHPDDVARASHSKVLSTFLNKPLTEEALNSILKKIPS